jgi:monofunctional biosynthetic peptidoglycan transglycosylase
MFIRMVHPAGKAEARCLHNWVPIEKIPNSLQLAVVCTEDQHFLVHHGFDFDQIRAAMDEADSGGRVRGASTISQQTAKNVFLWPSSSWLRKGFEAWFTVLIEICWSKERIMEVYLNSIEFGDGIYGCEAASRYFFKKPAQRMSAAESAKLAVVLPNPHRFHVDAGSGYVMRRQSWALNQMQLWGGVLNYGTKSEDEPVKNKTRKRKPADDSSAP